MASEQNDKCGCWMCDLASLMPEPDVVLDCGASVGQTANRLRKHFPKATIYSFEPVATLFKHLQRNCELLSVHPVKKAVADQDGKTYINLTKGTPCNSLLGYLEGNPCAQWTKVVGQEEIEVCTLDRWCQDSGLQPQRVDVLKLDVQGAELKALHGARKLLETVKAVYLEVLYVKLYKDCPLFGEIDAFMVECGYRRYAVYPSSQPDNWGDVLYVKA